MNLENDLEFRDAIKKIKIKLNSEHKMKSLDLVEQGIIILKAAAKTLRDTNISNDISGPSCNKCGSIMIKTGSCFACPQCGESGGC